MLATLVALWPHRCVSWRLVAHSPYRLYGSFAPPGFLALHQMRNPEQLLFLGFVVECRGL